MIDSEMTTCGYWKVVILKEKYEMLTAIAWYDGRYIHNEEYKMKSQFDFSEIREAYKMHIQ